MGGGSLKIASLLAVSEPHGYMIDLNPFLPFNSQGLLKTENFTFSSYTVNSRLSFQFEDVYNSLFITPFLFYLSNDNIHMHVFLMHWSLPDYL